MALMVVRSMSAQTLDVAAPFNVSYLHSEQSVIDLFTSNTIGLSVRSIKAYTIGKAPINVTTQFGPGAYLNVRHFIYFRQLGLGRELRLLSQEHSRNTKMRGGSFSSWVIIHSRVSLFITVYRPGTLSVRSNQIAVMPCSALGRVLSLRLQRIFSRVLECHRLSKFLNNGSASTLRAGM